MRILNRFILILVLLSVLSACSKLGFDPVPTPLPDDYLPTAIALTARAIQASLPTPVPDTATPEPTPTETLVPFTPVPTDTPTPGPDLPPADIQILTPGEMSKVSSPMQFRAFVAPGYKGQVTIELLGEDGRLLVRKVQRTYPAANGFSYLSFDISFEIRTAAEFGRLQVSTEDEEGRMQGFSSVHLLLLSVGNSEVTPSTSETERFILTKPKLGASISGGIVVVEGELWPFSDMPVTIELVRDDGKSAGLRLLELAGTQKQPFTTTIPYTVTEPTWARLVIRQADDRLEGLRYLYSREILLNP